MNLIYIIIINNINIFIFVYIYLFIFIFNNRNTDIDPFMSLRNILTTIFNETILRQRESGLMPILKDILKYQYSPLKRIAVAVMHRVYHDCEGNSSLS